MNSRGSRNKVEGDRAALDPRGGYFEGGRWISRAAGYAVPLRGPLMGRGGYGGPPLDRNIPRGPPTIEVEREEGGEESGEGEGGDD